MGFSAWSVRVRAAVIAAPVLLAGCMTQGSSSFVDAVDIRKQPQTADTQPVPFDVAAASSSGVVDATSQRVAPAAYAEPGALRPAGGLEIAEKPASADGSIVERSLLAEQEREVAALPEPQPVTGQFAALTPADAAALPAEELVDPLELAAEARIPALHQSIRHGECKGGWGPKPKMINARRVDPSHKYYMEMRLRHTPPLPVGHVYIAYGEVGPVGEPLNENLVMLAPVGGYAGATAAAAAPMPGVLEPYGDDCVLAPIAAYRLSLTAQQYEKLLVRIQQAKREKPRYALWTYNCNHFMSDVAAAVGILPPENKYTPSLEYFYAMMDRNEGRKVARSPKAETAELASAAAFPRN